MRLDIPTLFSLLLIQSLAMALMLPLLMGWKQSRGARLAQGAAELQALGWLLLMISPLGLQRWLASAAMLSLSASLALLWFSIQHWLGHRPGRWLALAIPPLLTLGYLLGFDSYAFRLGWSSAFFALQMLAISLALLLQSPHAERHSLRWRGLLGGSLALMALFSLARGHLAVTDTAALPAYTAEHWINTGFALMGNINLLAVMLAVLVAWRGETETQLKRLTQLDDLTGLCHRRAFGLRAVDMISMARRYDEPLALMLMDLDGFKQINAEHGEAAGDQALALFASCLQQQMRLGDLVARVGGQEFAVLMARSDAQGPRAMDLRVRDALAARSPAELGFAINYSAGWAKLRHGDRNVEDLLRRADAALYEAKRTGKGCLVAEPGLEA